MFDVIHIIRMTNRTHFFKMGGEVWNTISIIPGQTKPTIRQTAQPIRLWNHTFKSTPHVTMRVTSQFVWSPYILITNARTARFIA